jgi:hypothetical protein
MALRQLFNTCLYIELGIANIYKYFSIMQYIVLNFLKLFFEAKKREPNGSPFYIYALKY